MSSITDLVAPIAKIVFTMLFVGILFFVIYKGTFGRNNNWKFKIRYEVLKRPYPERIIKLCMDAIENGVSEIKLARQEIVNKNITMKQTEELIYIYRQVKKIMGG